MCGSVRGSSLGVLHVWEDLVGSSRVDGGTFDDSSSKATDDVIVIQVTLWGIDVSKVEWTGACWLAKIQGSRGRGAEVERVCVRKNTVTLELFWRNRKSSHSRPLGRLQLPVQLCLDIRRQRLVEDKWCGNSMCQEPGRNRKPKRCVLFLSSLIAWVCSPVWILLTLGAISGLPVSVASTHL